MNIQINNRNNIVQNKKINYYKTNYFISITFYLAIFTPIVAILITIPMIYDFKNSWPALLFLCPIFSLIEFLAIRYSKVEVFTDENGIEIHSNTNIVDNNIITVTNGRGIRLGSGTSNDIVANNTVSSTVRSVIEILEENSRFSFKSPWCRRCGGRYCWNLTCSKSLSKSPSSESIWSQKK